MVLLSTSPSTMAPLIAVSSCSPGWSWPNQSPGSSSQMVIWMTCCCYLFHLLHQTFHLLVRRSSIKFHIDWFRIVNCVFYSISGVRPPQLWLFFLLHYRFKRLATPGLYHQNFLGMSSNCHYKIYSTHLSVANFKKHLITELLSL